jgi:hypothetical protein
VRAFTAARCKSNACQCNHHPWINTSAVLIFATVTSHHNKAPPTWAFGHDDGDDNDDNGDENKPVWPDWDVGISGETRVGFEPTSGPGLKGKLLTGTVGVGEALKPSLDQDRKSLKKRSLLLIEPQVGILSGMQKSKRTIAHIQQQYD